MALFWARGRLPWHWGFAAGWRRVHEHWGHAEPPPLPGADEARLPPHSDEGCPPGVVWTDAMRLARRVLQDLGQEGDDDDDYWQIRGASEW